MIESLTLDFTNKYRMMIEKDNQKIVHTFKHCNIFHFVKALKKNGWKITSCQEVLDFKMMELKRIEI